jgi:hypothetical protein
MCFSSATSNRFDHYRRRSWVPGPGQYEQGNNFSKTGWYPVTNMRSTASWGFGSDMRKTGSLPRLNTPGPGTYRQHSDFGQVESKTARNFH